MTLGCGSQVAMTMHGTYVHLCACMTRRTRDSAEILIERARSLIPALRQRATQATAERRLPQETIDDFRRLGLTRCLQPAMFGGFGSDYRVFSKMLRTLAQGCGSSAWVCRRAWRAQLGDRQFSGTRAARGVGRQSRTPSRRRAVAPNGSAEIVAGGHRLNGRWGFASGCDHAQWILLGAMTKGGGAPRIADVPRADERGRDRRRLARHGPVRHRQQVGRRQGRRRARDASLGQPARTQDRHRARRGGSSPTIRSTARRATCWRCSR